MRTKTRERKRGLQQDKVNFDEGIKLWASYFRGNIHRFALDYLQLPLFGFQMILLYMMNINSFFYWVGSRGLGKSYITAVYCCCRCILYPNTKIVVASGTKSQARLLISQKIEKELMNMSPNLRREIKEIRVGANDAVVKFKNGSTIEAVASGESSRGVRCNILILDECRLISQTVLNSIESINYCYYSQYIVNLPGG